MKIDTKNVTLKMLHQIKADVYARAERRAREVTRAGGDLNKMATTLQAIRKRADYEANRIAFVIQGSASAGVSPCTQLLRTSIAGMAQTGGLLSFIVRSHSSRHRPLRFSHSLSFRYSRACAAPRAQGERTFPLPNRPLHRTSHNPIPIE